MSALSPAIGAIDQRTERCSLLIFCGAGLAKAWSPKSPLSNDLFCIPTTAFEQNESVLRLLDYLNKGEAGLLDQEAMTDVTTFLDLCEHHPALRAASMDRYSAARLRAELGRAIKDHYRRIHYINDLKEGDDQLPVYSAKSPHRKPMIAFLREMLHDRCEYADGNVGLDLCFITTNYDYAIESWLQESIDDPILEDLYRGFTPTRINGRENTQFLIDRPFSLKLMKLNGGFEIVKDHQGLALDYRHHQRNPLIVLPSTLQDYRSEYFQSVFEQAALAFRRADVVLFAGYSFPREDVLVRRLTAMLGDSAPPRSPKKVFSVNRADKRAIERALSEIFGTPSYGSPELSVHQHDFSRFCAGCAHIHNKVRLQSALH